MRLTAACLCLVAVTGCASDNVVVQPVSLKPVDARLMQPLGAPKCEPRLSVAEERNDVIDPRHMGMAKECYAVAEERARNRLHGLQSAVKARESAARNL